MLLKCLKNIPHFSHFHSKIFWKIADIQAHVFSWLPIFKQPIGLTCLCSLIVTYFGLVFIDPVAYLPVRCWQHYPCFPTITTWILWLSLHRVKASSSSSCWNSRLTYIIAYQLEDGAQTINDIVNKVSSSLCFLLPCSVALNLGLQRDCNTGDLSGVLI